MQIPFKERKAHDAAIDGLAYNLSPYAQEILCMGSNPHVS